MSYATFDAIKIGIASPEMIREWSHGEVKKPETINYRTLKPERDGLFCERIFGPTKDWECHCGKYKKIRYKGKICDRCGVEVTRAKVRRERMGHIELATLRCPTSGTSRASPPAWACCSTFAPRILEKVLYFAQYIVTDPGETPLIRNQILSEKQYRDMRGEVRGRLRAPAWAPRPSRSSCSEIDLEALSEQLHAELETASGQKGVKHRQAPGGRGRPSACADNKPEWMIIDVHARHPARAAPDGPARRRPLRHQRPERPLPPRHQPQQPPQAPASSSRRPISSCATKSGCCRRLWTP